MRKVIFAGLWLYFFLAGAFACRSESSKQVKLVNFAPYESTTFSVACPVPRLKDGDPVLRVSGWNMIGQDLKLSAR